MISNLRELTTRSIDLATQRIRQDPLMHRIREFDWGKFLQERAENGETGVVIHFIQPLYLKAVEQEFRRLFTAEELELDVRVELNLSHRVVVVHWNVQGYVETVGRVCVEQGLEPFVPLIWYALDDIL